MKQGIWAIYARYAGVALIAGIISVLLGDSIEKAMLSAILAVLIYGLAEVEWLLRQRPRR